jgi:lipopolysaccharide/colanic/teichoic acid biosynthesis glycosyltransferase
MVIFTHTQPTPVLLIPRSLTLYPAHRSAYSVLKRSLDIMGGVIGLLILALVVIPIALAIKLDSKGPVFYLQKRRGLQGRLFYICKFRSMQENADLLKAQVENEAKGFMFKNKRDPRITKVGRFIRRTSLDELPQFWNVLRGEMSLVGTRPPTEDEVIHYQDYHWQRLNVKPGMTGEWQVSGRSSVNDFEQIVALDLQYQAKWTPLYDLKIIGKTLFSILGRAEAY